MLRICIWKSVNICIYDCGQAGDPDSGLPPDRSA
jgi:hypothetical protein